MNKGTVEREPSKANEPAWIRATTQGNEALEGRTSLIPFLRSKTFQDLHPQWSGCFSLCATEKTNLAPMFIMGGLDKREDNHFRVLVVASDPDSHDGVISHLEPDILECEVKWALGSITTNKASGGDGIPVELFQILIDDAVKVLHSICQQI